MLNKKMKDDPSTVNDTKSFACQIRKISPHHNRCAFRSVAALLIPRHGLEKKCLKLLTKVQSFSTIFWWSKDLQDMDINQGNLAKVCLTQLAMLWVI